MAKVRLPIHLRTNLIGGDFGTGDANYNNVVLLLPFDLSSGAANKLTDRSLSSKQATRTGSPLSTTVSRFASGPHGPTGSLSLTGSQYIQLADSSDWFPENSYTIELDSRINYGSPVGSPRQTRTIMSYRDAADGWELNILPSGVLNFQTLKSGTVGINLVGTTTLEGSPPVWKHVAISRTSTRTWRAFVNGQLEDQQIGSPISIDLGSPISVASGSILYIGHSGFGGDEHFNSVTLLLPFDGTDGAASPPALIDQSSIGHTGNFVNQAQLDTAQKKFGTASALFDGTLDYIAIPDHISLSPEGESFTVEAHVRFNGTPATTAQMTWASKWNNGFGGVGVQKEWWIGLWDSGHSGTPAIQVFLSSNGSNGIYLFDENWSPTGDTWYHIAVVFDRDETTDATRVFVDGTQLGTDDTSINSWPMFFDSLSEVWIGSYDVSPFGQMNGWIDNVRITKGVARYKSNFTPPTAPYGTSSGGTENLKGNIDNIRITKGVARYTENFTTPKAPHPNYKKRGPATSIAPSAAAPQPTFSNVVILTGFENGSGTSPFTEESNNTLTITPISSATQSAAQSKFGTYSGLVVGGTLSRFTLDDNAVLEPGSSDFSIEGFYRFNQVTTDHSFFCCWHPSTEKTHFWWWDQSAGTMVYSYTTSGTTTTDTFTANWSPSADTWYHLAICRNGSDFRMFVNGVQIGSTFDMTGVTLYNSTRQKHIGYSNDGTVSLDGYVDEFRFVIGEAIYTSNFTAPTAAHPRS